MKTSSNVKIEVPINPITLDKLNKRAKEMGFNSVQGYIRFWAAAETKAQHPVWGVQDVTTPVGQALRYIELLIAMRQLPFSDMYSVIQYLQVEMRRISYYKMMKDVLEQKAGLA